MRSVLVGIVVLGLTPLAGRGDDAQASRGLSASDIAALRIRGEREGWTFTVGENEATRRPLSELCGAVEPPDWRVRGTFDDSMPGGRSTPPTAFDWRQHGGCTSIRNQASCGSCWAFAAVGAMESYLRIAQGMMVDLSEQWLVSCTSAGSCGGGWHDDALSYLQCNGYADSCGGRGAVLESSFPYVAYNAPCGCPYAHPYCIPGWAFVGPQWGTPSAAQIKQAVWDHGPIAVCIYANDALQAYNGGIFNACEDAGINHVVDIVGWDDNQGASGVWIIRNSWGGSWGESGYGRIGYGCSRVGYAAAYINYAAADCNNNGIRDYCEVSCGQPGGECYGVSGCGTADDCNGDNVPDDCQLADNDCNNNDVPDECDGQALFAAHPEDEGVCPGSTAEFTVTPSKPVSSYQWRKDGGDIANGGDISGATTATLTILHVEAGDAGAYTCRLTDGCVVGESDAAQLVLRAAPAITNHPTPQRTVCSGGEASFTVAASGTTPFDYEWRKDGLALGAPNQATLVLPGVSYDDKASYTCLVSNVCGEALSNAGVLNVVGPEFTRDPRDRCAAAGATLGLSAEAAADATIWWAWRKNGSIVPGQNTNTLTLANVGPGDAGQYRAVAATYTPITCIRDSDTATLTVGDCPCVPGDMDGDGDFDLADMAGFTDCFGPGGGLASGCECADVNGDPGHNVDLADWAAVQTMTSGPLP